MKLLKKTEYNAKIKNVEDKIPDISNLATKINLNTIINEVKNEIPSITGLATTSELTIVENKIPSISNLVRKKQIMIQKLRKLKGNLLIRIMINILLLLNLIN